MEKIFKYLSSHAIDEMKNAILEAHGNEVFFVGKTNTNKVIEEITTISRGNEFAVPVIRKYAELSDVVIHNHPSGDLIPSPNDLCISFELGELGISSYIINNEVNDIYVVIEPFDKQEIKLLAVNEICNILKPDGTIAQKLMGYEYRPSQIKMVEHVCHTFNQKKIAVIEAGTGVGKTLAYLLPAIYWSVNNKERCAVSTNTINLQEQLMNKDIPFLQSVLDIDFKAVLIKGRGNYICLRKVKELDQELELMADANEVEEIKTLIEWSKISKDGSKSDLNFIPKEQVWEKVAAESDSCTRAKCLFFKKCFVNLARRDANKANIIVVNHHLLFADLALRSIGAEIAVLPPYNLLILDEAHHIEDVATNYFGSSITRHGIIRILGQLYRQKEDFGKKGYLPLLIHKILKIQPQIEKEKLTEVVSRIEKNLIPQINLLEILTDEVMDFIFNLIYMTASDEFAEIKRRIIPRLKEHTLWTGTITEKASALIYQIKKFCSDLSKIINLVESCCISFSEDFSNLIFDIYTQNERLLAVRNVINQVLFTEDDENIRWVEVKPRTYRSIVRLKISPLEIAETMKKLIYDEFNSIVMTSATLTVKGVKDRNEFDYFSCRIGLNMIKKKRLITTVLPTSFNYSEQVIIGIPLDIPAPDHPKFSDILTDLILKSVIISEGRAFILFTSYGLLNLLYSRLEDILTDMGIKSLKQGSKDRHRLLEKFKQDKTSVLFATDSFWEGVDVQGDALESVIITKLPFKVPTEPIIEARVEAIKKRGGDPFIEYSIPQAVIKLKQGVGRLIRSKTDRGSILIFDKRILEKFYGRIFIESLPNGKIIKGLQQLVFEEIKEFFKNSCSKSALNRI